MSRLALSAATLALALLATAPPQGAFADGPGARVVPPFGIGLQQVASGLPYALLATHAGDGSGRLFIVQQVGLVRVMDGGVLDPVPYLDVRHKVTLDPISENGLLGLAFDPLFEVDGRVYVSYIDTQGRSVLERLVAADPANGRPDPDGEVLLALPQAYCSHKGGHIAFGPDGYLYWGLGDGGCTTSPPPEPQDPFSLYGKMLRLDVSPASGYAIPPTNPFALGGGRGEVWALGFRNPWRWSFDRVSGDLWVGDVGRNSWEEVNRQPALSLGGENYGWRWWEATHQHWPGASVQGMTFPVLEYDHNTGCSVTGGYVYHGILAPQLTGQYLYGDFCNGRVWAALGLPFPASLPRVPAVVDEDVQKVVQSGGLYVSQVLMDTPFLLSSFGEDETGEVYLVNYNGGVHRIVAA